MRLLWIFAILAFALDQGSKLYVFAGLELERHDKIDIWPPFLVFRPGINTGINFGLFSDGSDWQRWALIFLALGISALIAIWARGFCRPIEFIAGGLVIGGALGNALDRLLHPGVLDFLNMSCCGINNPYVFNIADVTIFAGAFGLAIFTGSDGGTGRRKKSRRPSQRKKKAT